MKNPLQWWVALDARLAGSAWSGKVARALATPRGALVLAAAAAFVYFFRIALHPLYHGDEMSLLMLPSRWVEFGDMRYPLIFSDSYNAGDMRSYPPVMAMLLRGLFHQFAGFSDLSSRVLSALMMMAVAGGVAALVARETRGHAVAAVSAVLLVFALNPSMIVSARIVRFEQEVFFMGMAAFLLALLFTRADNRALSGIVWVAAGLCVAWAGLSHPWGVVFGGVLSASLVACPAAWRERDGLGFFIRLICFVLGCLWPMALTLLQVLHNWPEFKDYLAEAAAFYDLRQGHLTAYFFKRYNIPLPADMPGAVAITALLQLHMTGFGATATKTAGIGIFPLGFLFQGLFWFFLYTLAAALPALWRVRKNGRDLPVVLVCALAAAFVLFSLVYPANQTYFLYAGTLVPLSALMLYVRQDVERLWLGRSLRWYALLCAAFAVAYVLFLCIFVSGNRNVSLDERHQAMREMGRVLDITEGPGHTLVDSATWPAGGKDVLAYSDVLRTARAPEHLRAIVLDPGIFNYHVGQFGKVWEDGQREQGVPAWPALWGKIQSTHFLRGLIVVQPPFMAGYHFLAPMRVHDPVYVTIFEKDGTVSRMRAYLDIAFNGEVMREGRYLLLGHPAQEVDFAAIKPATGNRWLYRRQARVLPAAGVFEAKNLQEVPEEIRQSFHLILPLQPVEVEE